jgi:hypothetical protein
MKYIPFVKFKVEGADASQDASTGDLVLALTRSHDGRGMTSRDQEMLYDLKAKLRARGDAAFLELENAEADYLKEKISVVRWVIDHDEIANFIRSVKEPMKEKPTGY